MTRKFATFAKWYAGAVLTCAFAGCAKDRQMQHAVPGQIAPQSAATVTPSASYSATTATEVPPAAPGAIGAPGQATTPMSNTQPTTAIYSSPSGIVTPSSEKRMFSPPSSCSKPGCNSCRN